MNELTLYLVAIPALPLAAAIFVALLGPQLLREKSHWPVALAIGASFLLSLQLVSTVSRNADATYGYERVVTLWTWAVVDGAYAQDSPSGGQLSTLRDFTITIALRADALTAMMLAMVTFISTLVTIFAAGYMHGDRGYWRFFTYIGLFVFSMTMLVSVSNFLLLYVFWEAVGVCSYLLIGFWYEKPEAAAAGKKAFLVNRVGDFGFALALFLIWTTYGTLNYHDTTTDGQVAVTEPDAGRPVDDQAVVPGVLGRLRVGMNNYVGGGVGLAICLLLLLGACGKSAQFPLHVWLPDAMEGPTPVSALIHAATMVTAGVYMVARCTPLFMASPAAQLTVACIGAFTALLAGLIALTQFDLKRVLAYSTISQLGYMFLGLGTGTLAGITGGMFHLFTHAFFKALLFLGAGSVMHAMGNVIDMRQFGGLRKLMPVTHATFLIGCLALAGLPPFAGFFSKDLIIAAVEEKVHELEHGGGHHGDGHDDDNHEADDRAHDEHTGPPAGQNATLATAYRVLFYSALFTAMLTAVYTFRAFFLTFWGDEKIPPEAGHHAHESPRLMTVPLMILAVCAVLVGAFFDTTWLSTPSHSFFEFITLTPSLADGAVAATRVEPKFHANVAITSAVIAAVAIVIAAYLYLVNRSAAESLRSMFSRGYGVSPYQMSLNKFYFDELYHFVVVLPCRALAALSYAVDRWIVDGLVNLVGKIPPAIGTLMRPLQMGLVQFYALAMVLGVIVLLAARMMWTAG